ncbi:hypothetical protein [Pseudomonas sp. ML2-2023-6]
MNTDNRIAALKLIRLAMDEVQTRDGLLPPVDLEAGALPRVTRALVAHPR